MAGRSRQRGAFLVLAALLMAVLLGMVALGIDVGRLYALRSEIQNAADAAALAAAAELDGAANARQRAIAAAQSLLQHDSRFATVAALLDAGALPPEAFTFYCIIGSPYDPPFNSTYCTDLQDAEGRYLATSDAEAHYVRVRLDPAQAAGRFRLQLLFLPVLSAIGVPTQTVASTGGSALGGRNIYTCDVPPMAICDPFEGTGTNFQTAMVPGQAMLLSGGGGTGFWAPGNFGFLSPPAGGPGAPAAAAFLANEAGAGCSGPFVDTEPGVMAMPMVRALNTRFDQYSGMQAGSWATNPPAPNVVSYPNDASWRGAASPWNRFGNGDWDFDGYWGAAHVGVAKPNGWSNLNRPTRWQVYNYEISNSLVPNTPPTYAGQPTPAHVGPGSVPKRRLVKVAVLSCGALSVNGSSLIPIQEPDGYAEVFFHRKADSTPNPQFWAEYVDWVNGPDSQYHVQVQLYE